MRDGEVMIDFFLAIEVLSVLNFCSHDLSFCVRFFYQRHFLASKTLKIESLYLPREHIVQALHSSLIIPRTDLFASKIEFSQFLCL